MAGVTEAAVIEQLRTVQDPELHKDLVTLNMIKQVAIDGSAVRVHVELTTPACPMKETIARDVTGAVQRVDGVSKVDIEWSAQVRQHAPTQVSLPGVKHIIAVGAGKGGVGKSTAAVMLAVGLHREGASVGLMDADVYGPSLPMMMGAIDGRPYVKGDRIIPLESCGVKLMSMGFMVDRDTPIVWRGPMVHGAVKQFLEQVEWGELDYLIVDLPPGTGDVPLTLAQSIQATGAVIVCTPQDVALLDATRAIRMYQKLNIACLGIIENMSYYICPHCGERDEIFDHGGAQKAAVELDVPFLGAIPLNAQIRHNGDAGVPNAQFEISEPVTESIRGVVQTLAGRISVRSMLQVAPPTLTIER
jgi:ATP-binding protein involved in chromosome partitioning